MKVIHVKMATATKPQEGMYAEVREGVLYIYTTVVTTAPNATMTVGVMKEETRPSLDGLLINIIGGVVP